MSIVSLEAVDASVGSGVLFEDVTLGIEDGEKIGLVGRNGSGKSTLLRILAGRTEPDEGSVVRSRGLRISPLDQRPERPAGATVEEYLFASPLASELARDAEEQADALQRYRANCTRLGVGQMDARLETLSGGMLRKIALSRCLAFEADLLTLDEPTNHLDLDTILWLEERLRTSTTGFVMVTHDRAMLESVCTTIFEISGGRVYRHEGGYSGYLRRRADREEEANAAERRRTAILRTELEWLQRGPKARTSKDKGRKDRIDALLEQGSEAGPELQTLPAAQQRLGKKVLELHDVAKSYDGTPVIAGFTHELSPGERMGIIGPNGSGKTTLLDIVAGRTAPDRGRIEVGETTAFAYFDQTGGRLDPEKTVLGFVTEVAERVRIDRDASVSAETFLERFLFPRSMHAQTLATLSGGELRRLQLVRLLAGAPNVLLFDEPTNDLDLETLRILEQYLESFTGCILLVSHDRALLDRLTDSLLVFDGEGGVERFVGSYDEYRRQRAAAGDGAAARGTGGDRAGRGGAASRTDAPSQETRRRREPRRGLSFREQREYEALPDEIDALEGELKTLEAAFAEPSHDPDELEERTKRYHALRDEVEAKTARWEELAERAERPS